MAENPTADQENPTTYEDFPTEDEDDTAHVDEAQKRDEEPLQQESTSESRTLETEEPSPKASHTSRRERQSDRGRQGESGATSLTTTRTSRSNSRSRSRDRAGVTRNFVDDDPNFEHVAEKYSRSPGPVYNTGVIQNALLHHPPTTKIGTEPRDKYFAIPTLSPGPAYNPDSEKLSMHSLSPRATFGKAEKRSPLLRDTVVSGPPLTLPPLEVTSPRSFRATFGKAARTKSPKIDTPGPGHYGGYEAPRATSKKGTFSTGERGSGAWIFK